MGPPENELGSGVPVRLVIARTDELALGVVDVSAYSTGFSLRLALRFHPDAEFDPRGLMMHMRGEDGLRFGVGFADGRKATSGFGPRPPRRDAPEIHLSMHGGGGGGSSGWSFGYWVYPLPPPGPVVLAAEWPGRFPETLHELDSTPIIEAAARSEILWEDDRPFGQTPPHPGAGPAVPGR